MKASSPGIVKTRVAKPALAAGRAVAWRDVLAALQGDETRSCALSRFREACFSADSFGTRQPREKMADILSRTEDWLEATHPGRRAEREAIKQVRRRLEWELFR